MNDKNNFYIVVTACPMGVAHTYVVAKVLQKAAKQANISIKIETNGSNSPTVQEINQAKGVIIASDKQIDIARFIGKKVLFLHTKDAIRYASEAIIQIQTEKVPIYKGKEICFDIPTSPTGIGPKIHMAITNGVSHMIPFIILSGLLIVLPVISSGISEGGFWKHAFNIGAISFELMFPILAGYIAYTIAGKVGLAPGIIGGWIANDGLFYHLTTGTGFLGVLVVGVLAGYIALGLKSIPWHKSLRPFVSAMIIPIVSTLIIGSLFIGIVGITISRISIAMNSFLTSLSTNNIIMLGLLFGLMQGFDMGGPIAKIPFYLVWV